jgi:hypothetical protein
VVPQQFFDCQLRHLGIHGLLIGRPPRGKEL